jgi:integrase
MSVSVTWIEERPGLRPKTIELYRYLLRQHLLPTFGVMLVADIRESHVWRWRKERLDAEVSAVTVAKAYRLLKAILNTAADDGLIRRNPCRIKGASVENSPERPVLTARQVFDLAAAIDPRYQAFVLLAVFASLRWGELAALRRTDVDLSTQTVKVFRQLVELRGGGFGFSPPKSAAGRRTVVIPAAIAPVVERHVGQVSKADDGKLLFTSPEGMPLRHNNFRRRFWLPARGRRAPADPLPRPASYREHARGGHRRWAAGADGPDGPLHFPGCPDIPACQRRTSAGDRGGAEQAHFGRAGASWSGSIGHVSGTKATECVMKIACWCAGVSADLLVWGGAPSATRTRDLLLRRHFPNVA